MFQLNKSIVFAVSLSLIAFILMDKLRPEYAYYEYKAIREYVKDGMEYKTYGWINIREEDYRLLDSENKKEKTLQKKKRNAKNMRKQKKQTVPVVFSLAVAAASFTLMYKRK